MGIKVSILTWQNDSDYQESPPGTMSWKDITNDVELSGISASKKTIDISKPAIGFATPSAMTFKVNDQLGKFTSIGLPDSIFTFKRVDSRIKLEWFASNGKSVCGWAVCGYAKTEAYRTLYEGLITEVNTSTDVNSNVVEIQSIGTMDAFKREVDFSPETVVGDFNDWMDRILLSNKIKRLISGTNDNAALIRDAVFSWGYNTSFDNTLEMIGKTKYEMIEIILRSSSSLLYIEDSKVFIKNRGSASVDVMGGFYGPYSKNLCNIISIKNFSSGAEKVYNYFVWRRESPLAEIVVQDAPSILTYGSSKVEYNNKNLTDPTKIANTLTTSMTYLRNPKRNLDLTCQFTLDNLALKFFDKVTIDYPKAPSTIGWEPQLLGNQPLSIEISPITEWIILGITYTIGSETITFNLREL